MEPRGPRQLIQSAFFLAASLLLAACPATKPKSTIGTSPIQTNQTADHQGPDVSCEFSPEQGETIALPHRSQKTALFFGKTIDLAKIESIYEASGKNTVQQITAQGVDVFGVTRGAVNKCSHYTFLPKPSASMQALWTMMEETEYPDEKPFLGGVFFPAKNQTQNVRFDRPTIMVGVDSHRHFLVHEYMHYLYTKEIERLPDYQPAQNLAEEIMQLEEDLGRDLFSKDPEAFASSRLSKTQSYKTLLRYLQLIETFLLGYDLEEVAIEAKFFDDYSDGRYKWMPDQRTGALGYMVDSYKKAADRMSGVFAFFKEFNRKIQNQIASCRNAPSSCSLEELNLSQHNVKMNPLVIRQYSKVIGLTKTAGTLVQERILRFEKETGSPSKKSDQDESPQFTTTSPRPRLHSLHGHREIDHLLLRN